MSAISTDSLQKAAKDVLPEVSEMFTDDELTALALAADPDQPLDSDAVPMSDYLSSEEVGLLPEWYMAPAMARSGKRWRMPVVLAIVAAFLLIEALGLCNTFGQLTLA